MIPPGPHRRFLPLGLVLAAPRRAEAARDVHRLRHQPHMAAHRHPALDQEPDGGCHRDPAFELDGGGTGFPQDAGGTAKRLCRAFLVGPEGEVDEHAGMAGGAHHGGTMRHHHVERDRQRGGQPVDHHPEAVAHQQHVAMRVEQASDRCRVGGEAHDRRPAFAGPDVGNADPPCRRRPAHRARLLRRPTSCGGGPHACGSRPPSPASRTRRSRAWSCRNTWCRTSRAPWTSSSPTPPYRRCRRWLPPPR